MFCSSLLIDKLLLVRVKFVLLEGNELFKNENIYLKEENISKKRNRGEKEKKIVRRGWDSNPRVQSTLD